MEKQNTTTAKDFALFTKYVKHYQELLGLKEWRIDIMHQDCSDPDTVSRAWFMSKDEFISLINLSKHWSGDEITNSRIKEAACHEVLHVLLADIIRFAGLRFLPNGIIDEEEHRIIRRLERAFTYSSRD